MGAFKDMAIQREESAMRDNGIWVEVHHEFEVPGQNDGDPSNLVEVTVECLVTLHAADRRTGDSAYGEVEDMRFLFPDCDDRTKAFLTSAVQDDNLVSTLSEHAIERAFEEAE